MQPDAAYVTDIIQKTLKKLDIDYKSSLIGLGFNGASVMSGVVVVFTSAINQIESPIICLFLLTSHVVRYNKRISIKVLNFAHLRLR